MANELDTTNTSFWANAFSTPEEADPDPIPTQNIRGSADDSSTVDVNNANYEEDFPFKDGTSEETRLPSPVVDGVTIDLQTVDLADISTETFLGFHSAHQLELLDRFGGSLVIGSGDERLDVLTGSDGKTVLVLQQLTKDEVATLSLEDQTLIADYLSGSDVPDTVKASLASAWGVDIGQSAADARAAAVTLLEDAQNAIELQESDNDAIYIEELQLIIDQLDSNALISQASIQSQIDEINERFERMFAFETSVKNAAAGDVDGVAVAGLNSLDSNATIASGLQTFLDQEQRILDAKKQRLATVASASNLDATTLIAILQLTYNLESEAEVGLLTEELEQQNALLRDYAEMQRLVNEALKEFSTGDSAAKEDRNILGNTNGAPSITIPVTEDNVPDGLTVEEARAIIMFEDDLAGSGHPLEILRGITRPTQDIINSGDETEGTFTLAVNNQTSWNTFATQLSDAVTLINQQSQILTNDISSLNQEQNRHFDLANNALRRLLDMVTSIARSS